MSGSCQSTENKSPISQILSILRVPSKNQLKQIPSWKKQNPKFHYYTGRINVLAARIKIFKANFLANLEIFQWRKQTEFPIVKTFFIKIQENHKKLYELIDLEVFYEVCPLRLTDIQDVPLSQSLYLTKQALIGYQRLFEKFGGFQVKSSMIAINEGGKCKVWINEDFSSNKISKLSISETKMLNQIISTIQAHTQQTKTSIKIFNSLRNCKTFLTALKTIEFLVASYKILVPCIFIKLHEKSQMNKNLTDNYSGNIRLSIPVNFSKRIRNFATPCSYYTRLNSGRDIGISALVTPHRSRSPRLIRQLKTQPDQNREKLKKFKSSNQTTQASTPASQMSFCFEGLQSDIRKNTPLSKFGNIKKIESIISITSEGQSDITFGKSPQVTIKEQTSIQNQHYAPLTKNIQQIRDSIFSQKFKFFNNMRKKPYYTEFQEVLGDYPFKKQRGDSCQKNIIKRIQWSQEIIDLNSHRKIDESIELKEQATLRLERMNKNPLQMSILSEQFQEQL